MIVIAVLALLLPGYILARALRSPAAPAAAFPLSVLLLTEVVIAYAFLGVPIRFGYVLAPVVVVSLIGLVVRLRRGSAAAMEEPKQPANSPGSASKATTVHLFGRVSKVLLAVIGVQVGLVLLGLLVRTTLYPLSGFDTSFRWEALARLMLEHEGMSYYPPFTSADFAEYFYPDAMPPLTATVYWWLYAAWGGRCPAITSLAVLLQVCSCLALVFYAARTLFGSPGGLTALVVLSSSSLFLTALAMGQETGYMALSCAGQLAFALAAARKPNAGCVVMAGLFGALGAVARDYGPLLWLSGFAVLACQRETRRYLPLFYVICVALGAPWCVRNWMITGNPL